MRTCPSIRRPCVATTRRWMLGAEPGPGWSPGPGFATTQTRLVVATLRAGVESGAIRRCKPLAVGDTAARLAPRLAPDLTPAQGRLIGGQVLSLGAPQ